MKMIFVGFVCFHHLLTPFIGWDPLLVPLDAPNILVSSPARNEPESMGLPGCIAPLPASSDEDGGGYNIGNQLYSQTSKSTF